MLNDNAGIDADIKKLSTNPKVVIFDLLVSSKWFYKVMVRMLVLKRYFVLVTLHL